MFPFLLGAIGFGAGAAMFSNVHHDVDIDGEQMVARFVEMLRLQEKLDAADGALRETLLELRTDSAALTAQSVESLKSVTNDVHGALACVCLVLLVVGVWYLLRMLVWVVWTWRGEGRKQEPVVLLVLGSGAEARTLGIAESGVVELPGAVASRTRARSSL